MTLRPTMYLPASSCSSVVLPAGEGGGTIGGAARGHPAARAVAGRGSAPVVARRSPHTTPMRAGEGNGSSVPPRAVGPMHPLHTCPIGADKKATAAARQIEADVLQGRRAAGVGEVESLERHGLRLLRSHGRRDSSHWGGMEAVRCAGGRLGCFGNRIMMCVGIESLRATVIAIRTTGETAKRGQSQRRAPRHA